MDIKQRLKNIEITTTLMASIIADFLPPDAERDLANAMTMFMATARNAGHDINQSLQEIYDAQEAMEKKADIIKPDSNIIMPH